MDMKNYDFDQVVDRGGTNCLKWDYNHAAAEGTPADILPFWIADMDFACADPIVRAIKERADKQIFGYCYIDEEYDQAISDWYRNYHSWHIPTESIFYAPGLVAGLSLLINMLTEPGEGIIIQQPIYYPFMEKVLQNKRVILNNALKRDENNYYTMDYEDLAEKAKHSRLMIFCSPHNPSGRVWAEEELRRMGEICLENGVTIISDEVHCDLTRAGQRHIPLETLFPEHKEKIITCVAASKTFNMAGLLTSNVILHDPELRAQWTEYVMQRFNIKCPSALALPAVKAAYTECRDWVEQLTAYLDGTFDWMEDYVRQVLPKAVFHKPQGTYLAWIDMRAYTQDTRSLAKKILREAHVYIEEGEIFGPEGAGFVRMNCAAPRQLIHAGLDRIAAVCEAES
jgi:cystathionine beta-lyase